MKHELLLNKEFFTESDLRTAKAVYDTLADIKVSDAEQYWEISFSNCKYGGERTVKEFENYMIGLANQ